MKGLAAILVLATLCSSTQPLTAQTTSDVKGALEENTKALNDLAKAVQELRDRLAPASGRSISVMKPGSFDCGAQDPECGRFVVSTVRTLCSSHGFSNGSFVGFRRSGTTGYYDGYVCTD